MAKDIVQSAWWIIYMLTPEGEPRFLLIKRHAVSGKVERVAPKGKIQPGEIPEEMFWERCLRNVEFLAQLRLKQKVGMTSLRSSETKKDI